MKRSQVLAKHAIISKLFIIHVHKTGRFMLFSLAGAQICCHSSKSCHQEIVAGYGG